MMMTPELRKVFIDVGYTAEWEEKAVEKERMKITKNMLARGVDPVIIAESFGLALDEIIAD